MIDPKVRGSERSFRQPHQQTGQKNEAFKNIEEILETSRSCPYSLSVFDLGSLPSVSRSRQKSQQISR
jgi:hypothetical protein